MSSLDRWVVDNVFNLIARCMHERPGRPWQCVRLICQA